MYHPFGNIGLKLLAIGIALVLWLAIAGEPIVERSMRVPLEFQNVPSDLELVGDAPNTVEVRLRGPSTAVTRLSPGDTAAVLDLKDARPGRRLFDLQPEGVRVPFGVEVTAVLPVTIPVLLEPTGSRVVPVLPSVEGDPAPGFVLGRITADPATIEVLGPESQLRRRAEAITEPVSVEGKTSVVKETVRVGVSNPALRLAQPRTAIVTAEIVPAPVERTVPDVPVRARNLNALLSARVTPSVIAVTVRGPAEAIRGLAGGAVNAYVDLAGLGSGRYNLPARVESTAFGTVRIEPATVEVRITR